MKNIKMIIAIMLMSCLMATSVLASGIMPYDASGAITSSTLSINGTNASLNVSCIGPSDTTSASFYIRLQKYVNGAWTNDKAWIEQVSGCYADINKSATVETDYTYRVEVHCFLYSPSGNANFYFYSNQAP